VDETESISLSLSPHSMTRVPFLADLDRSKSFHFYSTSNRNLGRDSATGSSTAGGSSNNLGLGPGGANVSRHSSSNDIPSGTNSFMPGASFAGQHRTGSDPPVHRRLTRTADFVVVPSEVVHGS
jgi:hypothetical protein